MSWPNIKIVPFEQVEDIHEAGHDWTSDTVFLKADKSGISLNNLSNDGGELHYCKVGQHPEFGAIATFYSARGPGNAAQPRPCVIIYNGVIDDGADFLEAAGPTPEPDFIDMTPVDEAIIKGAA